MKRLVVLFLVLSACRTGQTVPPQSAADEPSCPEPPPPVDPIERAASLFFEAGDLADWAEALVDNERTPEPQDVLEHLHALIELTREAERVAAETRDYNSADQIRMIGEEILILTAEAGFDPPEGFSLPDSLREELEQRSLESSQPLSHQTVLEDYSGFAMDTQQSILQVAETTGETAATNAERKTAQCLRSRLYSYTDLSDMVHLLEEDLVQLRLSSLEEEDRHELARLERELESSRSFLEGCRRGVRESLEAASRVMQEADSEEGGGEFVEIAREILESCS